MEDEEEDDDQEWNRWEYIRKCSESGENLYVKETNKMKKRKEKKKEDNED